jgi:thiosulfate reductase cytochrome b subunit
MPAKRAGAAASGAGPAHSLIVRVTHWINALAVVAMMLSGWRIYDAAPLYAFQFPRELTLGGWLAGALAWHFAAMWLLVLNGAVYLAYGLLSGHFAKDISPPRAASLWRDLRQAFRRRLPHAPGRYNAVQRLLYLLALALLALVAVSGLAIWKPVQMQELAAVMGGYEGARRVHFWAMAGLFLFLVLHVNLAFAARGVLRAMITGRAEAPR